jgi:hypothetical protein
MPEATPFACRVGTNLNDHLGRDGCVRRSSIRLAMWSGCEQDNYVLQTRRLQPLQCAGRFDGAVAADHIDQV